MAQMNSSESCKKRLVAAKKARRNSVPKETLEKTDKAKYLTLKYDKEHGRLVAPERIKEFERLQAIFEK